MARKRYSASPLYTKYETQFQIRERARNRAWTRASWSTSLGDLLDDERLLNIETPFSGDDRPVLEKPANAFEPADKKKKNTHG